MSFKKTSRLYRQYWKTMLLSRIYPAGYTDTNPLKLIHADPQRIKFIQLPAPQDVIEEYGIKKKERRYDKLRNLGRVIDGDWDTYRETIHLASTTNRMLRERFKDNKNWEEIDVYRDHLSKIERGESTWHRCTSRKALEERARKIERLFSRIAENGYRSQYAMSENRLKFIFKVRYCFDEVTVNIDRHGELLFNNSGANRLAISQVLGVESIPVRVLIRHRKWQDVRNEIREANNNGRFPQHLEGYIDHPDLQDIRPDGSFPAKRK